MSATIAYLRNRNYTGIDDIEKLKDDFYKAHIIVSYDAAITDGKRRVIFTKGMRSQQFDKITYECNGLVLEAPTWNPLTVPCPMPKSSVNNELFNKILNRHEYKVYKITDGTIIYLYYWADQWRMSTARGLDMANVELNGLTYQKLFTDVLVRYNSDWQAFTSHLDQHSAYSFVFTHSEIHPFMGAENERITFVHKTYVDNGKIVFDRINHGLPFDICVQDELVEVPKLRQIYSNLSTSLHNWLTTNKDPLFGYLFVSTAPFRTAGDHSCVLLESSLMRQIRQSVYDRRYMEFGPNRKLATVINGYLGPNRETFIKLFPQYLDIYTKLGEVQGNLVDGILNKLTSAKEEPTEAKSTVDVAEEVKCDPVDYLAALVSKKITIDATKQEEAGRHVTGIINNHKYTGVYMDLVKGKQRAHNKKVNAGSVAATATN
jgi:hypothetical protein